MAAFGIPMVMLLAHRGYIVTYRFFRERMHYGRVKSFVHVYLNHLKMGEVVVDRFASYAGKKFHFNLDGYDMYQQLEREPDSFIILSAHVGNYEIAGYTLISNNKSYNALVYAGESQIIMSNRNRIFKDNNIGMIPVRDDMSHIFEIYDAIDRGDIFSIPADRLFGSKKSLQCDFMGDKAKFPEGPFRIALMKQVPVISVMVMKTGIYSYDVIIRRLDAPSSDGTTRGQREQMLAQSFANILEQTVKSYPDQWFNYYDFWS